MTTSHGEVFKHSAINTNRLNKGKDIIVGDVDMEKWIYDSIKKKDEAYSPKAKENLILLIEGHIPTPAPADIFKLQRYPNYSFKGIYYVSLPVCSSVETDYTKNGFVVPVKDVFAQNEE